MSAVRLALMGIGNLRCGPPILASLATFFWERPLDIRMYDSDAERLDLLDRFARVCFLMAHSSHSLTTTESPLEALDDASLIVLSVGENCARKLLRRLGEPYDEDAIPRAIASLDLRAHPEASILSLQRQALDLECYYAMDWPAPLSEAERTTMPFQLLRWINSEEYPVELLQACDKSPLKAWLENPTTAEYVQRA